MEALFMANRTPLLSSQEDARDSVKYILIFSVGIFYYFTKLCPKCQVAYSDTVFLHLICAWVVSVLNYMVFYRYLYLYYICLFLTLKKIFEYFIY